MYNELEKSRESAWSDWENLGVFTESLVITRTECRSCYQCTDHELNAILTHRAVREVYH